MESRVRTTYGMIEGTLSDDGVVGRFLGVPYAKPPLGPLRWKAPQLPDRWDGVRPARTFSPACVQPSLPENSLVYGQEKLTSEDCLTLNVYTCGVGAAEKRPVIVWFHHGGFNLGWSGAPMYDGSELARAGAVVVTVNYRLGRLGFLAHPALSAESAYGASGNYGLLDQHAALKWVQENIAGFGGDPNFVTVYGVSAGSFSVSALMASPLAKGLFHRAIGSSGGDFGPISDNSEAGDFFQTLDAAEKTGAAMMAGIGAGTADEMRALSAEAILQAKAPAFTQARRGFLDTTYPIFDGHVFPVEPAKAFEERKYNDVPLITGSNAQESAISPFNGDTATYLEDSRALFGPLFERYCAIYPAGSDGLTMHSSMAAHSDRLFSYQNWTWARLQAGHGKNPVFYYHFAHHPPVPRMRYAEQGINADVGAFHSAEIPYTFRNLAVRDWPWSEADRQLSAVMSGYWLQFARTGNPNGGGRAQWDPFTTAYRAQMLFQDNAVQRIAPESAKFAFWDEFYAWFRNQ